MRLVNLVLVLFFLTPIMSCSTVQKSTPAAKEEKVVLYQMMVRLFANENQTNKFYGSKEENGVGKFNDNSSKALVELKDLGITHVWYTGVIEHATMTDNSS